MLRAMLAWKMGAKVPGRFGAQIASKNAPNIAGNVWARPLGRWEPRYLEVLRPKLLAKNVPNMRGAVGAGTLARWEARTLEVSAGILGLCKRTHPHNLFLFCKSKCVPPKLLAKIFNHQEMSLGT